MVTSNASDGRGSSTTTDAERVLKRLGRGLLGGVVVADLRHRVVEAVGVAHHHHLAGGRHHQRGGPLTCSGSPVPSSRRTRGGRPIARRGERHQLAAPGPRRPPGRSRVQPAGRIDWVLRHRGGGDAAGPSASPRTNRPRPDSTSPGTTPGSDDAATASSRLPESAAGGAPRSLSPSRRARGTARPGRRSADRAGGEPAARRGL